MNLAEWLGPNTVSETGHRYRWAFRGQPQEYKTLVPSFRRQFAGESFAAAELIEEQLIGAFRDHYAKLQDRSPDMPAPTRVESGYDLRCLSVMQHYEVPTRLLDWTSSFWTAVYFACASEPESNSEIWLYDRAIFDAQSRARPELVSLLLPDYNPAREPDLLYRRTKLVFELDPKLTPRMKQQEAHHTVSADIFADHAPLLDELQMQFVEESGAPYERPDSLRRIVIAASCKGKALQFLKNHRNITASTIFPDVVGLGRFLRWQLDSLRTMLL
jgi:hypothetical protein